MKLTILFAALTVLTTSATANTFSFQKGSLSEAVSIVVNQRLRPPECFSFSKSNPHLAGVRNRGQQLEIIIKLLKKHRKDDSRWAVQELRSRGVYLEDAGDCWALTLSMYNTLREYPSIYGSPELVMGRWYDPAQKAWCYHAWIEIRGKSFVIDAMRYSGPVNKSTYYQEAGLREVYRYVNGRLIGFSHDDI